MSADRLVDAYLKYLTTATEPLPKERRTDLIADVTSHIAEARAAGAESEADVRAMLKQLGDPDDIVAAATDGLVLVDRHQPRLRGQDIAALVLLPFGGYLAFVGWFVGVVLLWTSDRWTRKEKLLGTLVFPLGFVGVMVAVTIDVGFTLPMWLGLPIAGAIILAPIYVLYVLAKKASPGRSTQ